MAHGVNLDTCIKCGLCVEVCPNRIMEWTASKEVGVRPDRVSLCFQCGHCMAVCEPRSITAGALSYEKDFFDLPAGMVGEADFFNFIVRRRSVRNFQEKPVPREMLRRIIEAVTFAPMGFPPHKVEVTVIQNRALIQKALPHLARLYAGLNKYMKNPLVRFLIKRKMNEETFNTLKNHVLPTMEKGLSEMKEKGRDIFTRGAPALLLFHAPRGSENHTEDSHFAISFGLLAAHALGLGASAIGLIPPAVERNPDLRSLFQIPEGNEVLGSMIVGYPQIPFRRGIRRELPRVTWVEPKS